MKKVLILLGWVIIITVIISITHSINPEAWNDISFWEKVIPLLVLFSGLYFVLIQSASSSRFFKKESHRNRRIAERIADKYGADISEGYEPEEWSTGFGEILKIE